MSVNYDRHEHAPQPKREYVRNRTRICQHCYAEFKVLGTRNSQYCPVKSYRSIASNRPAFIEVSCAQCGAKFRRTLAAVKRVGNVFCSQACSALFNSGERHPHFRGHSEPYRGAAWRRLRDEIRLRDDYRCRRCGICEFGLLKKLSIDHVRPWRTFTDKALANSPDNLVALCPSCHSHKTTVV